MGSWRRRITEPALLPWGGGPCLVAVCRGAGRGREQAPLLPGSPTSRYIDPRLPNSPPGRTLSSLSDTVRALDTGQLVEGGQYLHWTRDTGTCGHSVDTADQGVSDTRTRGANNGSGISQGRFLRTEEVTFGQYRKGRL